MSHDMAAEFERLNIERKPKGTTAGAAGAQHTSTGLVERHTGLMKLTMLKLKAELDRQGIVAETSEIAMESAMAHNCTLNYGRCDTSNGCFWGASSWFLTMTSLLAFWLQQEPFKLI